MGFKKRNKVVVLVRPRGAELSWWPQAGGECWVTVHDRGWTSGVDKSHAVSEGIQVNRLKRDFLEEYEELVDEVKGLTWEWRVESV